jgi:hypothetical protein
MTMIRPVLLVALSILVLCFGLAEARLRVFAPRFLEAIDWAVSERSTCANKVMASTSRHSGTSADSPWAAAEVADVDVASTPPKGEGIVSIWLAKAAASGVEDAAKQNSFVQNAGANGRNLATAPQPSPSQDIWSIVCSTCSKAQVDSCLLSTALDAPSRTYDPSAAVFHTADTYDCLVNTDGCCAANDADDGWWLSTGVEQSE